MTLASLTSLTFHVGVLCGLVLWDLVYDTRDVGSGGITSSRQWRELTTTATYYWGLHRPHIAVRLAFLGVVAMALSLLGYEAASTAHFMPLLWYLVGLVVEFKALAAEGKLFRGFDKLSRRPDIQNGEHLHAGTETRAADAEKAALQEHVTAIRNCHLVVLACFVGALAESQGM